MITSVGQIGVVTDSSFEKSLKFEEENFEKISEHYHQNLQILLDFHKHLEASGFDKSKITKGTNLSISFSY